MSQQRRSFSQIIQSQVKKGEVVEFELNREDFLLRPMFRRLFMMMQFDLSDIPPDFNFYIYIPVVKQDHTSVLPYKFYVRMTTPNNKTVLSWRFKVNLDSRRLHNKRFNRIPVKQIEMNIVEHETSSQQYSRFVRDYLKPKQNY
jgi:hypothetical protein